MKSVLPLSLLCITSVVASVSRQIQLGDLEYFVPPEPVWKIKDWNFSAPGEEFTPITVVNIIEDPTGLLNISHSLEGFEKDDVWTEHFANANSSVMYYQTDSDDIGGYSTKYNATSVYYANDSNPAGPYFVHRYTGNVYQAYRLYADTSQAFIQSTYQDPNGTHHPLRAGIQSAAGLTIAVPSRLYFTPTAEKPLAGLRIGIKDLFDMKGVKTSFGSKAWYDMSKVKKESAIVVQKLIDAGAVIVGKNKLSEFAFAGLFVTEHIDYLLPVNPRGDAYQSPSDSSGGSAAAVASYDWLDASLGSDTGGSIRGPAATNGVHGGRPSQDAVNLTGALPLSTSMDTAGIIVRDPRMWANIEDFERDSPEAAEAVKEFLDGLSKLLSTKPKTIDVDKLWGNSTPEEYKGRSLADDVLTLYGRLCFYEQWAEIGKDFIEEYQGSNNGAFPYMVDGIREGWLDANKTYTKDTYKDDLDLKNTIEDWVEKELLSPDKKSCSEAIYVYISVASQFYKPDVSQNFGNPFIRELLLENTDQKATIAQLNQTVNCNSTLGSEEACKESTTPEPSLNDTATDFPTSPNRLASIAGIPDYAITLGAFDMGSFSNVTLQNQTTPVSVNIMAGRGCDFVILDILEALHKEGVIRKVKTGAEP
ncbi:unnamed protein product [Fusarium venenatum]|uniref:Amidase domain-containing protein n=1 Tax=Fusarium venenatum TaxID=56646 RepID=A0A2L2TI44_9HYPO|nr:uncharacterized protein FVRRES_13913 [Fusarium venenatum]CEI42154.1 unnamed protein product [Fusarium venenatum]